MISSARSPGGRSKLATPTALSANTGAVTEAYFEAEFQQPIIQNFDLVISSARDVTKQFQKIHERVYDKQVWEKRVDGLKLLRKCVRELMPHYTDAFFTGLSSMSVGLQACLDDARILVMREACITIAFIARKSESASAADAQILAVPRFACIASEILPVLIRASSKDIKCVSSCAAVAVNYIIKFTKTPKIVRPFYELLAGTGTSAAAAAVNVRKSCLLFIVSMLKVWDRREIGDKNVSKLANAILAGLNHADDDIRNVAGKALVGYYSLFPEETKSLILSNVDIDKPKVESLIKNLVRGTSLVVPGINAPHQIPAIEAEHAKDENMVVSGSNGGRPTAAVTPKPYFSTGLSVTVPNVAGSRPLSAFEQQGSSSGGGGGGENGDAVGTDVKYTASFMVNNGIVGSSSVSDFRPSASANSSNIPRNSPQNVTPTSHAADVNSVHEDELKNLQNQLAKTEAENRKLKADEAARKAAAPKMRYTMVYDKHRELVMFQLLQCKNLPLVSLKGDAMYHPADTGFNGDDHVEPSASAVVKLVNTSTDAVVPPLAAPKGQDEDANHLRVSRAEKAAGSAARPRRSSSFSAFVSHLTGGGDDDFERKTKKPLKKNLNPYFAETFRIPMLPSTLAEGKCVLCVEIVHHVQAKLLGREKKLTLGKARVVLNAESVVSTEMPIVEHECELF